jgi:putative membrane protein insertion efficiency factor
MVRSGKKIASQCIFQCIKIVKILFQIPQGCCRYSPTCSEYAKEAIEKLPVLTAIFVILKRVIKCNPLFTGGFDPVQERDFPTKG